MACCILTSKNITPTLIRGFLAMSRLFTIFSRLLIRKYIHYSLFVYLYRPKTPLLPSVSTLTSTNLSCWFFVVSSSLNTFFVPFSGILTCTYINQTSGVSVSTLNTRSRRYYLFTTAENVSLTIHAMVWLSKH